MIDVENVFAILTVAESLSLHPGQSFELRTRVTRVGRGKNNDIVIPDPPVSRDQAEIRHEGDSVLVCDLGSTYGTFVGEQKVSGEGFPIKSGDVIRFGTRTTMKVSIVTSGGAQAMSPGQQRGIQIATTEQEVASEYDATYIETALPDTEFEDLNGDDFRTKGEK